VDLTSYFELQERNIAERSVLEQIKVEIAPDDRTGTLEARANLRADTELDASLRIYERAVAAGRNKVEVAKYTYYLVIDGDEYRAWERDPTHTPPVHGHMGSDHRWIPAPEVTVAEALDLAWNEVQLVAKTQKPD
jgi:hypothetical protein